MPLQISSLSADFKTRASSPYLVFECEGVRAQTKATKVRERRRKSDERFFFLFSWAATPRASGQRGNFF